MTDNIVLPGWELEDSGFDDYRAVIADAYFGEDSSIAAGQMFLHLIMSNPEFKEDRRESLSCGSAQTWAAIDNGKKLSRIDGGSGKIAKTGKFGMLVQSLLETGGQPMIAHLTRNGYTQFDADAFAGISGRFQRMEHDYKGQIGVQKVTKLTAFDGIVNVMASNAPMQAPTFQQPVGQPVYAPAPVVMQTAPAMQVAAQPVMQAPAPVMAPAPAPMPQSDVVVSGSFGGAPVPQTPAAPQIPGLDPALSAHLVGLAKASPDHTTFMNQAFGVQGVAGNPAAEAVVMNDRQDGLWYVVKSTPTA